MIINIKVNKQGYSMPKLNSYHDSCGRFAGDASQANDFHSNEWTRVRNKKSKGNKKIWKLLGSWNVAQDTK
jgi:hypothetical protein